jgi:DDE superfamily endonuclease
MAFLSLVDSLQIRILILPPHATHRLQPLDVGLFSPLAKAYTKRLVEQRLRSACALPVLLPVCLRCCALPALLPVCLRSACAVACL